MILAVDAGNTRIKWALHDGQDFVREGRAATAEMSVLETQWAALPAPSLVVIANVAGGEAARGLGELARRWGAPVHWAVSGRSQGGVANGYEDPGRLGVDRWAALIGARKLVGGTCVVVNAGTATTIDALNASGEFLGGFILPGFDLMRESLAVSTALISGERGRFTAFPRNTGDAIASGSINALCGAVERMCKAVVAAGHGDPELVFSGGAGELIAGEMGRPVRFADKLVLEGLVRIAAEVR